MPAALMPKKVLKREKRERVVGNLAEERRYAKNVTQPAKLQPAGWHVKASTAVLGKCGKIN